MALSVVHACGGKKRFFSDTGPGMSGESGESGAGGRGQSGRGGAGGDSMSDAGEATVGGRGGMLGTGGSAGTTNEGGDSGEASTSGGAGGSLTTGGEGGAPVGGSGGMSVGGTAGDAGGLGGGGGTAGTVGGGAGMDAGTGGGGAGMDGGTGGGGAGMDAGTGGGGAGNAGTSGGTGAASGAGGDGGSSGVGGATAGVGGVGGTAGAAGAGGAPICSTDCSDSNVCTDDACAAGTCVYSNNAAGCDDQNYCTVGDTCASGACQAGTARDCSDMNDCTLDACHPVNQCTHAVTGVGSDGIDRAIPDSVTCGVARSRVTASVTITDPGVVSGLKVAVDIYHPYVGDLEITLRHVSTGTVVYLVNEPVDEQGNNWGDLNGVYTFADGAPTLLDPQQDIVIPPATYAPEEPLSAFVGEQLAGEWRLQVGDLCPTDVGLLRSFTLRLGTACTGTASCDGVCDSGACECE